MRKFLCPKNREAADGGPGLCAPVSSGVVLLDADADAAGAGARGGGRVGEGSVKTMKGE